MAGSWRIRTILPVRCRLPRRPLMRHSAVMSLPMTEDRLKDRALWYLGRYACTRRRLSDYLTRHVRKQLAAIEGAEQDVAALVEAVVQRCTAAGLLDDQAYAQARVRSLERRGKGRSIIRAQLGADGVEKPLAEAAAREADPLTAAVRLMERRRFGCFAIRTPLEPERAREKQFGAMVRAGHAPGLARRLLALASREALEAFVAESREDEAGSGCELPA